MDTTRIFHQVRNQRIYKPEWKTTRICLLKDNCILYILYLKLNGKFHFDCNTLEFNGQTTFATKILTGHFEGMELHILGKKILRKSFKNFFLFRLCFNFFISYVSVMFLHLEEWKNQAMWIIISYSELSLSTGENLFWNARIRGWSKRQRWLLSLNTAILFWHQL